MAIYAPSGSDSPLKQRRRRCCSSCCGLRAAESRRAVTTPEVIEEEEHPKQTFHTWPRYSVKTTNQTTDWTEMDEDQTVQYSLSFVDDVIRKQLLALALALKQTRYLYSDLCQNVFI